MRRFRLWTAGYENLIVRLASEHFVGIDGFGCSIAWFRMMKRDWLSWRQQGHHERLR